MNEDPKKKYLILDTNILQLAGSKPIERSSQVIDYIVEIAKQDYERAISDITAYEALQRCSKAKEKEVLKQMNLFTQLEVSKKVLVTTAWSADLYRGEKIPDSQISDCDKIIASTAILTGSLILTADGNDFPRPFFSEKEKRLVQYKDKSRDLLNVIYLLEPDLDVFKNRLLKRPKN